MKLSNILLSSVLTITSLAASDFDTSINYFGNLTGSTLNKDGFNRRGYQVDDVENNFQLSSYSKLGLQATLYNDDFMFVVQGVTRYEQDKIQGDITWLNAKYNISDNFSIRAGRMQTAGFLDSDTRDVNYLNIWTLEPASVYNMMPMKFYDGVELIYNKVIGDYYLNISVIPYGEAEKDMNNFTKTDTSNFLKGSKLTLKDYRNISLSISNENFRIKGSYGTVNMDLPIYDTAYHTLISTLEAQGNDMSKYSYMDKKVLLKTLGLEYTYDDYYLILEVSERDSDSLLASQLGYYALFSYEYNNIRPFVMYAKNEYDPSFFDTNSISDTWTGGALKTALEQVLYGTNDAQETYSIGLKYDIKQGIALNTQLDKINIINYGTDYNNVSKRLGYTQKDIGIDDNTVYQFTVGISFAF